MNTNDIFIHLKSHLLKKGLTTYLLSWGYAPQSISKEGIANIKNSQDSFNRILIGDEDLYLSGMDITSNFSTMIFKNCDSNLLAEELMKAGLKGSCNFDVTPGQFNQGLRSILQGDTYFQPSNNPNRLHNNNIVKKSGLTVLSDLTSREREVLRYIANEHTNKKLLRYFS